MSIDLSQAATQDYWSLPEDFYSCLNARGLYSPLQFVLRLRPDIHLALDSISQTGSINAAELTTNQVYAFSTYIHENIHWWQHVGSSSGLILSLLYPAQHHFNRKYLSEVLAQLGPKKPMRAYALQNAKPIDQETELDKSINVVINNWHDIEFYKRLIIDPSEIENHIKDPFFECVGHSFVVTLGAVLHLLSSTIDHDLEIIPDPRTWDKKAHELKLEKFPGFYHGSPIFRPPLGVKEIFEGQARFNQLQFLYFASGAKLSWSDFEAQGMFEDVYILALEIFIQHTGLGKPIKMDDSTVGLFLLTCDISINPVEGLIVKSTDLENLIEDHDPGMRFMQLCEVIRHNKRSFELSIVNYSAKEYWSISDLLCSLAGFLSPRKLMETVRHWANNHQPLIDLLEEDSSFNFSPGNLPVRLFFSRFVKFQIDKYKTPEFFCWAGVWMTTGRKGNVNNQTASALFEEHRALFVDKADGIIYPRTFLDRVGPAVQETFDSFYSWVALYELTRQWIVGRGEFDCRFSWLTTEFTRAEMKTWATHGFEQFYGVHPDQFEIISES